MHSEVYNKKTIQSGNITEVIRFNRMIKSGYRRKSRIPSHHRLSPAIPKHRQTRHRRSNASFSRSKKNLRRLINCNYTHGKSSLITLTYRIPEADEKKAKKDTDLFIRKMKRYLQKNDLKYTIIPEWQRKRHINRKEKSIHFHVIFYDVPYISKSILESKWGNGFVRINQIKETVNNVGGYLTKDMKNDDRFYFRGKLHHSSLNLDKPIIEREYDLPGDLTGRFTGPDNKEYGKLLDSIEFENNFCSGIYMVFHRDELE